MKEAFREGVLGVGQIFVKRIITACITLLEAKVSDDFLVARKTQDIGDFRTALSRCSTIDKITDGPLHHFGGCEIHTEPEGSIFISMEK